LTAYLVVAASVEVDFEERVAVAMSDESITE
jgi:hypothetical protein